MTTTDTRAGTSTLVVDLDTGTVLGTDLVTVEADEDVIEAMLSSDSFARRLGRERGTPLILPEKTPRRSTLERLKSLVWPSLGLFVAILATTAAASGGLMVLLHDRGLGLAQAAPLAVIASVGLVWCLTVLGHMVYSRAEAIDAEDPVARERCCRPTRCDYTRRNNCARRTPQWPTAS